MRNFSSVSGLLIIGLLWLVFSGIFSSLRKAAEKQKQPKQPAAPPNRIHPEENRAEPKPAPSPAPPAPPVPEYYVGSLNVSSMEGIDPCHQEQMRALDTRKTDEAPDSAPARPGLTLSWSADDVVRGFVYGEILNRKRKT